MKKVLTLALSLLAMAAMALAQDTSTSQTPDTLGAKTTVQGCLNGSHDNWTLTDASGKTFKLSGNDDKWKGLSGHMVEINGREGPSNRELNAKSQATGQPDVPPSPRHDDTPRLHVNSARSVADTCSGATTATPPSSDLAAASAGTAVSPAAGVSNGAMTSQTSSSTSPLPQSSESATTTATAATAAADTTAQSTTSATQSATPDQSQNKDTMPQSSTATAATNSVRGCLQGSNGSFTLKADDGRMFQLTGDTSKLNDNVDKEVEVMGNAGSSDTSSNSNGQSNLNVTDVRKVNDSCSSGTSTSTPPPSR